MMSVKLITQMMSVKLIEYFFDSELHFVSKKVFYLLFLNNVASEISLKQLI